MADPLYASRVEEHLDPRLSVGGHVGSDHGLAGQFEDVRPCSPRSDVSLGDSLRASSVTWLSEGKVVDSVCKLFRLHDFRDQLEVAHALSDGCTEPVYIKDSREASARLLASPSLDQEIPILRKEGAPQFGRAVQQQRIGDPAAIVFLGRDDINTSKAQAERYGPWDVFVQVECDAQRWMRLSFAAMREGPSSRRACSTYSDSRSMSASSSAL